MSLNNSKPATVLLILLAAYLPGDGQTTIRQCGSSDRFNDLIADSTFRAAMSNLDERVRQETFGLIGGKKPKYYALVTIQVAVHVLYQEAKGTSPAEGKVTQAQVDKQIATLNRDYNPAQADRSSPLVPTRFRDKFGFPNIRFSLASVEWTPTRAAVFSDPDDNAKKGPDGVAGKDPGRFLNIWVVPALIDKEKRKILGYSSWPREPAAKDGVVIFHEAFGTGGTARPAYDLGHTTAHEIGHWLGLHHLWGDQESNPNCVYDDGVEDTAKQYGPTQSCPAPLHIEKACDGNRDGVMFPNFMDYTQDACMSMFTADQVVRMRETLDRFRSSFLTPR
jgi:hypothetical protein